MSVRHDRGRAGEEHVCVYLAERGYRVAARNFRVRGGEIDIVAENGSVTAFVEVKTRKFGSLTEGMDAVGRKKRSCMIYAADRYLERFPTQGKEIRFDVAEVTVTTEEDPRVLEMKYYEGAFDAFDA